MVYARIAVNVTGMSGEYDYHIPPAMEGKIGAGHLVTVPFGKQVVQGVVLELVATPAFEETKAILDLVDPQPVLFAEQLALARWLATHYLSSLASMLSLMIPSGLNQQADTSYTLNKADLQGLDGDQGSQVQRRFIKLLQEKGSLRGRQVDRHFKNVDWRKTAQYLIRRGLVSSHSLLPPVTVRPKFIRTAQLAVPPAQAESAMKELGKTEATQARRQAALRFLVSEPEAVNVSWVYAASGCNLADLQELEERGLIILRESEIWRDPLEQVQKDLANDEPGVSLTPDQQAAWEQIQASFASGSLSAGNKAPAAFLLQGVTGSGKTELYLRAAQEAIRRGRSVILLVPEIALTPQTVRRFLKRFPGEVGLVHSKLSPGERYDTWRRARLGLIKVIIGPRSALFAPLQNIGLIVADECHDGSYHQSEPPFYNAVNAAQEYARLCGAVCILGSATPTIVQQYQAGGEHPGNILRLALPRRIVNTEMPPVQIVDMREELKSGNRGIFSQTLVDALAATIKRGEQAILFLNRRGTATYIFCRECGYVAKCPQCDTPLTQHMDDGQDAKTQAHPVLVCHQCNHHRQFPKACPDCGSAQIRAYGLGSERVESEVGALFPGLRTLRWDWETTRQKDAHEIILGHFAAHRADVLVGTQMLAKGLDLPLVTLVGIVLADVGLNLPDPFAPERSFNLLTQVAGRAGRSERGGRVVLQTFQPDHYVIQATASHDVSSFFSRELEERRRLGYPPFQRLLRLEYRHFDAAKAESEASRVAEQLRTRILEGGHRQTSLIGPAPCFFSRQAGVYRWQVIVRGPQPGEIVKDLKFTGWRIEVDPVSLL